MLKVDKIYKMDCIEGMKQIGGGTIDMILTDPPYGISYKTKNRKEKNRFSREILNDSNLDIIEPYLAECFRILKNNAAAYVFCSAKTLDYFMKTARCVGFNVKNIIIWVKGNGTMGDLKAQYAQSYEPILYLNKGRRKINGKRITDVWNFRRVCTQKLVHQNQKPIPLLMQSILKSSNEGDLVFDGFMGSASTAIACMRTNRHFLGFELDEYYYEVAQKRLRDERQNSKDMFGYEE